MTKMIFSLFFLFAVNSLASDPGKYGDDSVEGSNQVPSVKTCQDALVKRLVLKGYLVEKFPSATILLGYQDGDKIDVRLFRKNDEGNEEQCLGTFGVDNQCQVTDQKMDALTGSGGFERLPFSCHELAKGPQDD